MIRFQSYLVFAFLSFMVLPVDLIAQGGSAPVIFNVTVDYMSSPWQIRINGRNFRPSGAAPTIYFNNELVDVQSARNEVVVASLLTNPTSGTYLLTMTNSRKVTGTAYVTIGAAGPPGTGSDQPVELTVNCGAEGSVNSALANAGNRASRTTINIFGFCNEDVNLDQSNITFRAADGSPDAGFNRLQLNLGAHGIRVEKLRIAHGLGAVGGSTFRAEDLRVDEPEWVNVHVGNSASGVLINSTLTNCHAGCIEVGGGGNLFLYGGTVGGRVLVLDGGSTDIFGTRIWGSSGEGLGIGNGSFAYLDGAIIEENGGTGIRGNGTFSLYDTTIRNNAGGGIDVQPGGNGEVIESHIINNDGGGAGTEGGVLRIQDTEILQNGGPGFGADLGGNLYLWGCTVRFNRQGTTSRGATLNFRDTVISDNVGRAIEARNASTVLLAHTTVENNTGDGIWLGDVSFLEAGATEAGGPPSVIRGNGGYGLFCSPAPSVAQYKVYGSGLTVSGNAGGDPEKQIKCVEATN